MKQADAGSTAPEGAGRRDEAGSDGRRPANEGGGRHIPPEAPVIGRAPKTSEFRLPGRFLAQRMKRWLMPSRLDNTDFEARAAQCRAQELEEINTGV